MLQCKYLRKNPDQRLGAHSSETWVDKVEEERRGAGLSIGALLFVVSSSG